MANRPYDPTPDDFGVQRLDGDDVGPAYGSRKAGHQLTERNERASTETVSRKRTPT